MAYRPEPAPFEEELAGLDALEAKTPRPLSRARRVWSATWPKLAAVALVLLFWQILVWVHFKPLILSGPGTVFRQLGTDIGNGRIPHALATTMERAGIGYATALVLGSAIGMAVARVPVLRAAVGSLITGLQTMPSVACFPLALAFFGLSETAILSVVILGATPSIANGLIAGIDNVPPLLLRAGRVLGARGISAYRHVILPAAFPSFIGGMKQGWAFAWRSLMAGELLVQLCRPALGLELENARLNVDYAGLMAIMIVILVVGIVVDSLLFGVIERRVRRRWGLIESVS
ncbi:MAG TPA: ABC transporter permease subunit [Actinomycetota bacterium]|nr:ABC transporter permease subunit [Actinomycetota bacterium]